MKPFIHQWCGFTAQLICRYTDNEAYMHINQITTMGQLLETLSGRGLTVDRFSHSHPYGTDYDRAIPSGHYSNLRPVQKADRKNARDYREGDAAFARKYNEFPGMENTRFDMYYAPDFTMTIFNGYDKARIFSADY